MALDGEAWDLPPEYNQASVQGIMREFRSMLSWFTKEYGSQLFGLVEIPMDVLAKTIMRDDVLARESFRDFDEYHEWYISGFGIPNHPKTSRWPVILSGFPEETLQDGWHRLHVYYRQGARTVPAVYFP
jgi:hypothetical protein